MPQTLAAMGFLRRGMGPDESEGRSKGNAFQHDLPGMQGMAGMDGAGVFFERMVSFAECSS